MEIVGSLSNEVKFREIEIGEAFIYGECFYMKVECEDVSNAVGLEKGNLSFFENVDMVTKIKCKLVVG